MTSPTDSEVGEHRKLRENHEPVVSEPRTHESFAAFILGEIRRYGTFVERCALAARDGNAEKASRLAREAGEHLDTITVLLSESPDLTDLRNNLALDIHLAWRRDPKIGVVYSDGSGRMARVAAEVATGRKP